MSFQKLQVLLSDSTYNISVLFLIFYRVHIVIYTICVSLVEFKFGYFVERESFINNVKDRID